MKRLQALDRAYHTLDIKLANGTERTFKIPSELTVGELERILEAESKIEKLSAEQVTDSGSAQLREYWGHIFAQLEVIFRHYQPEIDAEFLRDNLLPADSMRILAFFIQNRYIANPEAEQGSDAKKKLELTQ